MINRKYVCLRNNKRQSKFYFLVHRWSFSRLARMKYERLPIKLVWMKVDFIIWNVWSKVDNNMSDKVGEVETWIIKWNLDYFKEIQNYLKRNTELP